ncbi:hypothetical protein E1B28_006568 [Marasmius oreades]|nr:uncharacterized protein E1B28_006568 [Marasmius oreades]KAG7095879.1 hypothetical protein E1B28_006568 [Marasmius oreades]
MFWLDYLEYVPLTGMNLDGSTLRIDSSDARVVYNNASAQWMELGGHMNGTGVAGGNLSLKFNGTSVSLYTYLEGSEKDWSPSSARYHIDNAADESITIPGSKHLSGSGNRSDFFNQLLFTSPDFLPGEHELTLSFDGVAQSGSPPIQWLVIDYFHVIVSGTNISSNGAGVPSTSVLVGAVAGGLVGLVAIGLSVYFFMKWRKQNRRLQSTPWYGGTSGGFGLGYSNHKYTVVTPFIPEEDSHPSPTAYDVSRRESSMGRSRPSISTRTRTTTTYPTSTNRHLSNASTSTSDPLISSSELTSFSPNRTSSQRPPTVLSPPNHSSESSPTYFDPDADFTSDSTNAGTRSTKDTGTPNVIHIRHEDSGIRLVPRGNDPLPHDLPPDYTPD